MGVVIVQPYAVPEGKNGTQTMEMLQKRVENLGGVKVGTFCVECESYYSVPNINPQRCVHIIHTTEFPASCFALSDTGSCLVADLLFDALMSKMAGIYTPKKATRIEARGQRYEVTDFMVKIGSVSIGSSFKGILVEVEYQPCSVPSSCWDLMKEFVQGFMGPCLQTVPPYLQNKFNDMASATDTIHQYMENFNNFRKVTVPAR
jgi:mediator of RNA polymerase II transcription subunit 20